MTNRSKGERQAAAPVQAAWMEGAQRSVERWPTSFAEMSQAVMRFTQMRLGEDVEAWQAFAACRSPGEAINCQQRYACRAREQYSQEIVNLAQLLIGMAAAGIGAAAGDA